MYAAGLIGLACGYQFTVTSQAWGGDPQQPERHSLTQTKYDDFVTSAYYWELN